MTAFRAASAIASTTASRQSCAYPATHDQIEIAALHAHQGFLEGVGGRNAVGRSQRTLNQATDSGAILDHRIRPAGCSRSGFGGIDQAHALAGRLAHPKLAVIIFSRTSERTRANKSGVVPPAW